MARTAATKKSPEKTAAVRTRSDTRERLLLAAIEMFGSRGFESTTMRDLAAEVGIKAPAAYNHFASKEEILAAAIVWGLEDFNEKVTRADTASDETLRRLEGLVVRHVRYQLEHARMAKANDLLIDSDVLDRFADPEVRGRVRSLLREHLDLLTDVIGQIRKDGIPLPVEPRLCALAIGSMCDRVLRWYRPSGQYSPERIAKSYWLLVRNMLALP